MTDLHQVEGLFRDRGQANLGQAAARRQGLDVPAHDDLLEDAAGVHLILRTTGSIDKARQLRPSPTGVLPRPRVSGISQVFLRLVARWTRVG